eukprot:10541969-Lingulodinium_polyedra.AAC.1
MQPHGAWQVVEILGPGSLEEWTGCWKVCQHLLGLEYPVAGGFPAGSRRSRASRCFLGQCTCATY